MTGSPSCPRRLGDVPTPSLIVELPTLERNVAEIAELASTHGLALRPHAKTHKSVEIARLQRKRGAVGVTVAKISEGEVLAAGGIDDIFVCYPVVGDDKLERLVGLARRVRVSTIVETVSQAQLLSQVARKARVELEVTVDVDTGLGRIGVPLGARVEHLAETVDRLPALVFRGLSTHEGFVYGMPERGERARVVKERLEAFAGAGRELRASVVSSGATPTIRETMRIPGLTEVRPGNYVYFDAMQVALGVATPAACALTVLTTVVSVRSAGRAIVDAGSKAFSADAGVHGLALLSGYGLVAGRTDIEITGLSEEHGWIQARSPGDGVTVGERLRVIPNHACATVANFDRAYVCSGEDVVDEIAIDARGALQ